jgi:predicted dehydrogenase
MNTRRAFLKTSAALSAGVAMHAHAAGADDTIKVALIGCGGRGTGAATQALNADKNVKLVAMGDAFADRLEQSLAALQRDKDIAGKIDVKDDKKFVGFDAYKRAIDSGIDVAILATPPGFRPIHMRYAIEKGKHVFAEKPCAVDAPGVRSVLETAKLAKEKGLSLVAGLQYRYSSPHREIMKRVHGGAIGEVTTLIANDYRGSIWVKPRQKEWSDMMYQMRNWYYFTWLSGDFNVEQHVHMLDLCAWLKNDYPVKAVGMGGRAVRNQPEHGQIYDHFSVIYEFADGAKLYAQCRQSSGCYNEIGAYAVGTKGKAELGRRMGIMTNEYWKYDGPQNQAVQIEHDELFASIRKGMPINNGEYLARSSLLAILGRMVCYTGKEITWEQALNSKEDLSPPKYDWDVALPEPPVAKPGVTKFV